MTTLVSQYLMSECLGAQTGSNVIVYHDRNRDGRVAPSEYLTIGPANQPFRFKDAIANWDGMAFTAPSSGSGGYTQADMDAAEKRGWNAGISLVAEFIALKRK